MDEVGYYCGKIITRPTLPSEKDLLPGSEFKALVITELNDVELKRIEAPANGWTHFSLESVSFDEYAPDGWDAYLGSVSSDNWIGSSEV